MSFVRFSSTDLERKIAIMAALPPSDTADLIAFKEMKDKLTLALSDLSSNTINDEQPDGAIIRVSLHQLRNLVTLLTSDRSHLLRESAMSLESMTD